jgi:hypothetical protein
MKDDLFAQQPWGVEKRQNIIKAIKAHYGEQSFKGKTVLELGCGNGEIGIAFAELGAIVDFSDARGYKNIINIDFNKSQHRFIPADVDLQWPFQKYYDYIFHIGLLYHLVSPWFSIFMSFKHAQNLVLETEVLDSEDPYYYQIIDEHGFTNSVHGKGFYPTASMIESFLYLLYGINHIRFDSELLNVDGWYKYDAPIKNSGLLCLEGFRHRRLWFCNG